MDAHIIDGGAAFRLLAVMRFLTAAIAIMRQRILLTLKGSSGMIFHAMKCKRSYAHCVALNKKSSKYALIVACVWENISVQHASYLMMISQRDNTTAMVVEFAELHENFFHCFRCGCCYSILLKNSHPCVEGAMHHDCPVCFEYLFHSTNEVTGLPCGHTIHVHCLKEMQQHLQYACPLCSKSVCDMSEVWEKWDEEIAATPKPESYHGKRVRILCNDCGASSDVQFHVIAQKCLKCKSYNTRQL